MKFKKPLLIVTLSLCLSSVGMAQDHSQSVSVNRYSAIEIGVTLEQSSLLQNVVDIHIPPSINIVGEGIRYLLAPYGYLINTDEQIPSEQTILLMQVLPEPHRHLALMTVVDALTVLGGESFEPVINPVTRTVQYELKESYQHYVTPLDIEQAAFDWSERNRQIETVVIEVIPEPPLNPSHIYGPILSGESLGSITESLGLNGMSLAQRMIQIFQENPHAFSGGNMNALEIGAQLSIPVQATASMPPVEAAQFVRDQYSQWSEGRVGQ